MRTPALVVAFDAWVDAGGAASGAATYIARGGETIASYDTDALLDYRTRRPTLDVVDGEYKQLVWQELTLKHVGAGSRDILVLSGPEPDHRWKEFASSVVEMASRLGVVQVVALGALPAAVPHTRPVPLVATATPPDQLEPGDRRPEGLLRVPAAALSVVQAAFIERGVPVAGFFAQVPHYVAPVYWPGVRVLVERLSRHVGVVVPTASIAEEADRQRAQLDAIVAERPEVGEHVRQLEALAPDAGLLAGGAVPSGDEIAAEVERFLRESRPGEP